MAESTNEAPRQPDPPVDIQNKVYANPHWYIGYGRAHDLFGIARFQFPRLEEKRKDHVNANAPPNFQYREIELYHDETWVYGEHVTVLVIKRPPRFFRYALPYAQEALRAVVMKIFEENGWLRVKQGGPYEPIIYAGAEFANATLAQVNRDGSILYSIGYDDDVGELEQTQKILADFQDDVKTMLATGEFVPAYHDPRQYGNVVGDEAMIKLRRNHITSRFTNNLIGKRLPTYDKAGYLRKGHVTDKLTPPIVAATAAEDGVELQFAGIRRVVVVDSTNEISPDVYITLEDVEDLMNKPNRQKSLGALLVGAEQAKRETRADTVLGRMVRDNKYEPKVFQHVYESLIGPLPRKGVRPPKRREELVDDGTHGDERRIDMNRYYESKQPDDE